MKSEIEIFSIVAGGTFCRYLLDKDESPIEFLEWLNECTTEMDTYDDEMKQNILEMFRGLSEGVNDFFKYQNDSNI